VNLWPVLFENLYLERGRAIISNALDKLTIAEPLEQCLQQINKDELTNTGNTHATSHSKSPKKVP
jgi:hypothetical protein